MNDLRTPKRRAPTVAITVITTQFTTLIMTVAVTAVMTAAATPAWAQSRGPAKKTAQDEAERQLILERELLKATAKAQAAYLKDLDGIVGWAAANGLPDDAKRLLEKIRRLDPAYKGIEKLGEKVAASREAADPAAARKTLASRLDRAGEGQARRLFDLAKKCMQFGLFTRSYELVKAVIEVDPDHKQARNALSYAWDYETKTWVTKWEAQMKRTHYLTPEGWVAKKDRSKWEKGLRPYLGNWVTQEEEKRIRGRSNVAPYEVDTEHFVVRSNLGREKAYEFTLRLEDFYRVFFEFFVGFYDQKAGAEILFNVPKVKRKHVVEVFPSRVDYLDFVRERKGNDELLRRSGGFWSGGDKSSFFFWTEDPAETLNTLYHETTHQLFGETKPESGSSKGNVWIVEGIAVYMETWAKVDGVWWPGYRIEDDSLQAVRRFLAASPDWTLEGFMGIEHKRFHDRAGRGLNYALGGALAHFFLHHQGGIYREDFIQLIRAYYDGRLVEDSLPKFIRVEGAESPAAKLATLQTQFRAYMKDLKRPGEDTAEEASGAGPETKGDSET